MSFGRAVQVAFEGCSGEFRKGCLGEFRNGCTGGLGLKMALPDLTQHCGFPECFGWHGQTSANILRHVCRMGPQRQPKETEG